MPRLTGKRALVEQLVADGVRYVFGNPGTTEQGFMDVLQEYPQIEFMLALHEGVAVGMADAYARAARRPAFVEVHTGPGLGNALGMIYNATMGKTPMVVYAGHSPSRTRAPGAAPQRAPRRDGAASHEVGRRGPSRPRRATRAAARVQDGHGAARRARSSCRCRSTCSTRRPRSRSCRRRTRTGAAASIPAALAEVARRLLAAERPMVMAGDSVAVADAQPEAGGGGGGARRADLRVLRLRVQRVGEASAVPGQRQLREPRARARHARGLRRAPRRRAPRSSGSSSPSPSRARSRAGCTVVQIDLDAGEIGKNFTPDVALLADPKAALAELAEQIRRLRTPAQAQRGRGAGHSYRGADEGPARTLLGRREEELGRQAHQRPSPHARDPTRHRPTTPWCSPRPSPTPRTWPRRWRPRRPGA